MEWLRGGNSKTWVWAHAQYGIALIEGNSIASTKAATPWDTEA